MIVKGQAVVKGLKPYQDRDTGEVKTPSSITVSPDEGIDFMESAKLHNKKVVVLWEADYENLISGNAWMMPESTRQGLKTVAAMLLDLVNDEK